MFNERFKKLAIIIGACFILVACVFIYLKFNKKEDSAPFIAKEEITTHLVDTFFVDVKGAVKKPGVYEFIKGDKVIDAINIAGGLTKYATTSNINLSQKLVSEMVVYVYTSSELSKKNITTTTSKCVISTNDSPKNDETTNENISSAKVNINDADLNTLMTISGIGEAKAKAIISYRTEKGKFITTLDIKNVSGIGDVLFAQIKDYITV